MMRRYSLSPIRLLLVLAAALVATVALAASAADAVVVQDNQNDSFGVALTPSVVPQSLGGTDFSAEQAGGGASCADPGLSGDFGPSLPAGALCLRDTVAADGATVLPKTELFAFTWDAHRLYWTQTRGYLEQFLRDVADAGKADALENPFAVTSQYTDVLGNRAATPKLYGGGCIDLGSPGGYTCQLGNTSGSGDGNPYPVDDLAATASEKCAPDASSGDVCLTDAAIRQEVSRMLSSTGADTLKARTGNTPLVVMMLPAGVEVCLNSAGKVCSVNKSTTSATFCTYHAQVAGVPYVVLPWTVGTSCDATHMPALAQHPTPPQLEVDYAGARLIGPLSGGIAAALVNPFLNGWFGNSGYEIDDKCDPGDHDIDQVPIGNGTYVTQPAFNNAHALQYDAYTYFGCPVVVNLDPTFVVPSAVNVGDTIQLDGSATPTTLLIPKAGYHWDFGDGGEATGPSVEHSYGKPGDYSVKLTVTDRGLNTASIIETVQILGPTEPPPAPSPGGSAPGSGSGGSNRGNGGLNVRLQLLPQSLQAVLKHGITVRVSSNKAANGIATVWITRASAKKAHIKVGRGAAARIGIGTVASITNGTVTLRLHLSAATAKKLSHLHHVAMTIRLALVSSGSQRVAVVAAGRY